MLESVLVLADEQTWLRYWPGTVNSFEDWSVDLLESFRTVVLAPSDVGYTRHCLDIIDMKRKGRLQQTRLILGTYKGRHLWTPENDHLVNYWVVHARSERLVLDSDRLVFVPLCVVPPLSQLEPGDDGYIFMGGRKWRELDVGTAAISRSGHPGLVISDFAPEGEFPGVTIRRERVPKKEYSMALARSRLFLVPLRRTPISHGHVDVVTATLVGKPILVTAGASCDDYVEHGVNGLLVPDNSIEAWVDAIHEAWGRADEFAAAARERAPRYHARMYAQYLSELVTYPDG